MKQLLLSLFAACSIAPAFAQDSKYLYYGSLGGMVETNGIKTKSMFVNSGLGYNLCNNFTLGVQGGFSNYRFEEAGADVTTSSYRAGIFGRYTSHLGKRVFVYAQADASYGAVTNGGTSNVSLHIYPGVGLNVGRHWALTVNMNAFTLNKVIDGGTSAAFNLGQGYHFGVMKSFGYRHKAPAAPTEK